MRAVHTLFFFLFAAPVFAQRQALIRIDPTQTTAPVSPTLHGVFFEEISHAGEGGIYAELVQNRGFEETNLPPGMTLKDSFIEPPRTPHFSIQNNGISDWKMDWSVKSQHPAWRSEITGNARMRMTVTTDHPLNAATPHSMQVDVASANVSNPALIINEGFWGMNIIADDHYNLSFYVRSTNYRGSVTASLRDTNGLVLATSNLKEVGRSGSWKKYELKITARKSSEKAELVLAFDQPGTLWLDFVSLFPQKTFRNRTNGLREDLAQYIADLKPAFIRWPGGCFVEGITIQSAPDWKKTIGPVEKRPGTYSPWGYWTSDGFGYHEFLQYCEDIGAAGLYVFNAGVSCDFRSGTFAEDDSLQPYIQNALDAIEYAVGSQNTRYGSLRAKAGHPRPFPLKYVEVGNEQYGPRYAERYNRFYAAIKERYPAIEIMASMGIGDANDYTIKGMKKIDYVDEHAYKAAGWAMNHFDHFDKYARKDWKMYVGEYATNSGVGAGNLEAALSDAIYIMSMEKNGDLVKMSSYAPLLVNTNDVDWPVNLINFNASTSFARISYYAIKMMNEHRADVNIPTTLQVIEPSIKKPSFSGSIGFATWDTQTEYADVEIIENGKSVYRSDFKSRASEWQLSRGGWVATDSSLRQTAEGPQLLAWLKERSFDIYTLKLRARKLGGYNAFIVPFAVKDDSTQLRVHIGSWLNKNVVFERVTRAFDVAGLSNQVPLEKPIETGRWYDIRLEVGLDKVECYLDGKRILTYTKPPAIFSIAGKEKSSGDIIIKLVNASAEPIETIVKFENADIKHFAAEMITLTADKLTAENSFEAPKKFVPVKRAIAEVTKSFRVAENSINVLRIRKW